MKIELKGGLGNQMFQYAFGRKVSLVDKKKVVFDLSFFNNDIGPHTTKREYSLSNFNIVELVIDKNNHSSLLKKLFKKIILRLYLILNIQKNEYYQNEKYFIAIEDIIRKEFTLKNPPSKSAQDFNQQIKSANNPVSIHIRRGDYAKDLKVNKVHGTCDIDYYQKALDYIKEKIQSPTFFFFSDDIEWVKENFNIENSVFVSSPKIKDYEELILMSTCSHHIVANSTFSWWGAWLNPNKDKIVIAPKQWTTKNTSNELDILPKEWVQL